MLALFTIAAIAIAHAQDLVPEAKVARSVLKASSKSIRFGTVERAGQISFNLIASGGAISGNVGAVGAPFAILAGGGSFALADGEHQAVTIGFSPDHPGKFHSSIAITSNAGRHPSIRIALSG